MYFIQHENPKFHKATVVFDLWIFFHYGIKGKDIYSPNCLELEFLGVHFILQNYILLPTEIIFYWFIVRPIMI